MVKASSVGLVALLCSLAASRGAVGQQTADVDVVGAWRAEEYRLASGPTHRVDGLIFFAERDWTVLFFVVGADNEPRRGSGEGGTYAVSGDRLVFTHRYHLSAGDALPGLSASPLRMIARGPGEGPEEPSRVERAGDVLEIFFPSGNSMRFRRSVN